MAIYFLDSGPVALVKIGFSADIRSRLPLYQGHSPVPITLLASDPAGDTLTEAELHWRFRHLRDHHDWFRAAPDLLDVARCVAEGRGVPDGWYIPGHARMSRRGKAESALTLTMREVRAKFGLNRKDVLAVRPDVPTPGTAPDWHIPMAMIPALVAHLVAHGVACQADDFFPAAVPDASPTRTIGQELPGSAPALIARLGGYRRAATIAGVPALTAGHWHRRGVPHKYWPALQAAGVTLAELEACRPKRADAA